MKPIQWLLIGGPGHGLTFTIAQGSRVQFDNCLYDGENYHHEGTLYRIGRCQAGVTVQEVTQIPSLIRSTRLRSILG